MHSRSLAAALILLVSVPAYAAEPGRPGVTPSAPVVSLADFRACVDAAGGLVIDTRSDQAFRQGRVPGALSLPALRFGAVYAALKPRLESDKNQRLILYCGGTHCGASDQVATRLTALGYTRVEIFSEGWTAWTKAGLPIEKSPDADTPLPTWRPPASTTGAP